MAHSASRTSQGFEFLRVTSSDEELWIPGDPGDSIVKGDQLVGTVGEGVADIGAANEGGMIGTALKTMTVAASSAAFPKPDAFDPGSDSSDTLVPIRSNVPAGCPVYLVTFENHLDETATAYTAATPSVAGDTGAGADDRPNGAIQFVYEGPGVGEVNVVADYDHTGHADGELAYVLHRKYSATLTTSSKFVTLAGEAAASTGMGFFNRCEQADDNGITTNQGANDGDYVIYLDWRDAYTYLKDLMLPVIPARYLLLA